MAVHGVLLHAQAGAQPAAPVSGLLKVFLDCDRCDSQYVRQNVEFVDYVRDRAVADVHVLVTTQGTGGGGQEWTLKFIGLGPFVNQDRTLAFRMPQTATDDETRREFARVFRLGLAGYAAASDIGPQLGVIWNRPADAAAATPSRDPWNYWVFRINGSGNMNGEQRHTSRSLFANASANRTTDDWKVQLSANRNSSRSTFELDDRRQIVSASSSWTTNVVIVKSLSPRWSAGVRSSASHSTFSNIHRSISVAPAIEFDIFPYSESARRALLVHYNVGLTHYDYREVTIFDKETETVAQHTVYLWLSLKQPWGSLTVYPSWKQHLDHPGRHNASVFGDAEIRLFKGLSLSMFAQYNRLTDQISLPKAGASTEDVLLQLRQLETGYSYSVRAGLTYSFGSIFNSIVNIRFD